MPGRVSTRNSTAIKSTNRSSTTNLKRTSAPATSIPEEGPVTDLRTRICAIFSDAQRSTTGHRKLVISLRKIQESCCYEPENPRKNDLDGYDENDFNTEIGRCVLRLLPIKKTEGVGDRVVKFFGQFLKHASEKGE
jgi:condensin complex subunit 3